MFVNMLREHIDRFGIAPDGRQLIGIAPDGRQLSGEAGGRVGATAHGRSWARAREDALGLGEHAVGFVADRPSR
ncbi:hypothetical protein [Streptomyces sp. NPDC002722]|uniref:hypothetical protein n=1 Tax=unclassified Streptomyces TaxID=2593676 RepID=UPI003325A3AE